MTQFFIGNRVRWIPVVLTAVLLVACAGGESIQPEAATPAAPAVVATEKSQAEPTATEAPAVEPTQPAPTSAPAIAPTSAPMPETPAAASAIALPIEVTYFTPAQAEGPYYPVAKPTDQDNDLVVLAGAAGTPVGEILDFAGILYDAGGMPVAGAVIEIWQTDDSGVYLHPNDPGTARRDVNFQFYGETATAEDGSYTFRTLYPGHYEPRPRHIHVKVMLNGQELLTTQFYFDNDPALATDPLFANASGDQAAMIMAVAEESDAEGNPILVGTRDVILRLQLSNP